MSILAFSRKGKMALLTLKKTGVALRKLCQPVPGHPELTSNKMAQIWNYLKLNNAKSIACVIEWYRKNPQS